MGIRSSKPRNLRGVQDYSDAALAQWPRHQPVVAGICEALVITVFGPLGFGLCVVGPLIQERLVQLTMQHVEEFASIPKALLTACAVLFFFIPSLTIPLDADPSGTPARSPTT